MGIGMGERFHRPRLRVRPHVWEARAYNPQVRDTDLWPELFLESNLARDATKKIGRDVALKRPCRKVLFRATDPYGRRKRTA